MYLNLLLVDNSLFTGRKDKAGKDVHLDVSRANLLKPEALKQLNSLLSCLSVIEIAVKIIKSNIFFNLKH